MMLKVSHSSREGVAIMAIQGRLDGNTSSVLEAEFLQLFEQGGSRFVFQLAELEYVSSAGLRSMLLAAKKLRASGGRLAMAQPSDPIREVFDMSGFSSIFTICSTEDEAYLAVR